MLESNNLLNRIIETIKSNGALQDLYVLLLPLKKEKKIKLLQISFIPRVNNNSVKINL